MLVDVDTDELVWCREAVARPNPIDITNHYPWLGEVFGRRLLWAWEMKNDQGYFDALQLEFASDGTAREVIIQFKVAASAIELFHVSNGDV